MNGSEPRLPEFRRDVEDSAIDPDQCCLAEILPSATTIRFIPTREQAFDLRSHHGEIVSLLSLFHDRRLDEPP